MLQALKFRHEPKQTKYQLIARTTLPDGQDFALHSSLFYLKQDAMAQFSNFIGLGEQYKVIQFFSQLF